MHDRLWTLACEKKRRWPEHLPTIVYAYNATPHSSTGYSSHFLLFGRDPKLPIDQFLGVETEDDNVPRPVDEWVTEHHLLMRDAFDKAKSNIDVPASARRERLNKRAVRADIPIGARVLTRNRVL